MPKGGGGQKDLFKIATKQSLRLLMMLGGGWGRMVFDDA